MADEDWERRFRLDLDRLKIEVDSRKPASEAVFKFAEITLRSLLILNGGAAIALLAFAANARRTEGLSLVVGFFCAGAAIAVLTAFICYLAQVCYVELEGASATRIGNRFRAVAIVVGVAGWLCFVAGVVFAIAYMT